MSFYIDIISRDVVLSDQFPWEELSYGGEQLPGIMYVQSKLVSKAEETTNDIKDAKSGFGYEGPNPMSANEFVALYKNWCARVKKGLEDSGKNPNAFMKSAKSFMDFLKKEFKNFEIYSPKSFDVNTFIVAWWDEEAHSKGCPKFLYFKEALEKH